MGRRKETWLNNSGLQKKMEINGDFNSLRKKADTEERKERGNGWDPSTQHQQDQQQRTRYVSFGHKSQ